MRRKQPKPGPPPSLAELRTAILMKIAKTTVTTIEELEANSMKVGGGVALDSLVACGVLSHLEARFGLKFDMKSVRREDYRTIAALIDYVQSTVVDGEQSPHE